MGKAIKAIVHERGNGFPSVRGYATDGDTPYRVIEYIGAIHTSQWRANYLHAKVVEVEWAEVPDQDLAPLTLGWGER